MSLYRPRFSMDIVVDANTPQEAWLALEDKMKKDPRSFISRLDTVERVKQKKTFFTFLRLVFSLR